MTNKEFPLIFADAGKKLMITGFVGGFGMTQRLADMGLTVGSPVSIIGGSCRGPLVLDVRGSRLGLGCGVAHKILVRNIADEQDTGCGNEQTSKEPAVID